MVDQGDLRKRLRTAWTYSGMDQDTLGKEAGIKPSRIRVILGKVPKAQTTDTDLSEAYAIAEAAGVPRRFIDEGFQPLEETNLAARFEVLEEDLHVAQAAIARLELKLGVVADKEARAPGETPRANPGPGRRG